MSEKWKVCRSLFPDVLKQEISGQGVKIFLMNDVVTAHSDLHLKLKSLLQFEDHVSSRFSEETADELRLSWSHIIRSLRSLIRSETWMMGRCACSFTNIPSVSESDKRPTVSKLTGLTHTCLNERAGGAAQQSDPAEFCSADGRSVQRHAAPRPAARSQTPRHAEQLLSGRGWVHGPVNMESSEDQVIAVDVCLTLWFCSFSWTDGLLVMNEAVLKGALTSMESLVGGVGQLVAEGVARCWDKVQQQEALCLQDKESVLQLLVRAARPLDLFMWPNENIYVTSVFDLVFVGRASAGHGGGPGGSDSDGSVSSQGAERQPESRRGHAASSGW